MPNWSIKTTETVDGKPVVRNYDVWALDYEGALNRAWHLDGVAVQVKNKDDANEVHHHVGVQSWKSPRGGTNP